MEMRVPYFLGVISYSIYLIHNPLRPIESEAARWMLGANIARWEAVVFAIAGTISVVPLAWIAYRIVEKPGRSFVRRLFTTATSARYAPAPGRTP